MVQTYKTRSHFDIPYSLLCPVYFLRYPNPLATHVLSVDVLSREIVTKPVSGRADGQQQHVLRTSRLILKRGSLPKWAPKGVIRNTESWVLEESEVELDPCGPEQVKERKGKGREMRSWTRNLDHTTVMAVTEHNLFREKLQRRDGDEVAGVGLKSTFDVTSQVSFGMLRHRIEKFGLNRVLSHIETSRQGILATHAQFLEQRLGVLTSGIASSYQPLLVPPPDQVSKRARLLAALRPPFLDGDFVGPIARLKVRLIRVRDWYRGLDRGGVGDESKFRVRNSSQKELNEHEEGHLTPAERLRKRFLKMRDEGRSAFRGESVLDDEEDDD